MNNKIFVCKQVAFRIVFCLVLGFSHCLYGMQQQYSHAILSIAQPEYRCAEIEIDPMILETYIGRYVNIALYLTIGFSDDDNIVMITKVADKLYVQSSEIARIELYPISETTFVSIDHAIQITFMKNSSDVVTKVFVQYSGKGFIAAKL